MNTYHFLVLLSDQIDPMWATEMGYSKDEAENGVWLRFPTMKSILAVRKLR